MYIYIYYVFHIHACIEIMIYMNINIYIYSYIYIYIYIYMYAFASDNDIWYHRAAVAELSSLPGRTTIRLCSFGVTGLGEGGCRQNNQRVWAGIL